jgi:MYXO-CTERM domain-containing protein
MRTLTTAAFLLAAIGMAQVTHAQARTFNLTLNGFNEPNPTTGELGQGDPDGLATGFVTLDPNSDMVTWDFNYSNISGAAISGFHIHGPNSTTTTNASVYIGFPLSVTTVPDGRQQGMLMTSDIADLGTRIDAVLANPGGFYLNLHSANPGGFPGGAVRAQLPEPGALGLVAVAGLALLRRRRR